MRRGRTAWAMAALLSGAALVCSCGRGDDGASSSGTPPTAAAPEITRTYGTTCVVGGKDERVEVEVRVSKAKATVADRVELVIEARGPRGLKVQWPSLGDVAGLKVLGMDDEVPGEEVGAERAVWRHGVSFEPFLPGEKTIPSMTVVFGGATGGGGGSCSVVIEPVKVTIESVLDSKGEEKEPELRGVVDVAPASRAWIAWVAAGGGVAVVAGAAGVVAWYRRRPRRAEPVTAYGTAMRRLREADEAGLLEDEKVTEYCGVLGETLREFVGATAGLAPAERTTEQLMDELGETAAVNVEAVRSILERLDEASYAGVRVSVPEAQELKDRVHKMVVGMQAAWAAAEVERQETAGRAA